MLKHSEEIKEIAQAICAAEAEMGSATELNGVNEHFKNRFSTLSAILKVVKPALNRHGIALIQSSTIQDKLVTVETMLIHGASGQYITDSITLSVPQTLIQVYGSAISYGRRYALQAMLAMCGDDTTEDDGEAAMGNTGGFKSVEFKPADKPIEVKTTSSAPEAKSKDVKKRNATRGALIREIFTTSAKLGQSVEELKEFISSITGKPTSQSSELTDKELPQILQALNELADKEKVA